MKRTLALCSAVATCLVASTAVANPKPLPYTYPHATLPQGDLELEFYGDFTPVRATSTSTGDTETYNRFMFQTEFEYGITDHLELGLYVGFTPSAGESFNQTPTFADGGVLKQRLRGRFAETGEWPIDLSLYFEVVERQTEIELEGKINLQRAFGKLRLMANLSAELEFYFTGQRDYVLNPTAGITYEVLPVFHTGLEYWTRVELPDFSGVPEAERPVDPPVQQAHFLGPAVLFNFGKLWWTTGAYWRMDMIGEPLTLGDAFGKFWLRTIVGLSI